jgi:exopolyphosphatase / guanosine-5'-triphosphate,3'-diphosphate pyrophosphatase
MNEYKFPINLAVIDLGSNSVRFDVYEITKNMEVERIFREKLMIRLGDGVFIKGRFDDAAMKRALDAFDLLAEQIKEQAVDKVVAFGTSALRESKNQKEFISQVKKRSGVVLQVLDGKDEARLIAKGILSNKNTPDQLFALIDIGGGSTEISVCRNKSILSCCSLRLGSNRLKQMFFNSVPPEAKKGEEHPIDALRKHIQATIETEFPPSKWPDIETIVGSSGTIRSFKRIFGKSGEDIEPYHRKVLSRLVKKMGQMDKEELLEIPGMEEKRVDITLAGGILLEELLKAFSSKYVYTSTYSLRDGILEDEIEKMFKGK